jgi:UDP-N-acetylglucosamine 4,6-dehydratase/5-epimerase
MKLIEENLKNKVILITGGTGSLGQALTERLLKNKVRTIRIFSRNESKQVTMETKFNDERLRFLIGDVRDLPRLTKACEGVDIVFHASALKHVPVVEYNPFESIKTNVIGSQNVIDACLHEKVKTVVCVSTDKAVSPLNTYGATKLLMEKLFVSANSSINRQKYHTKFITLRYGNVLGSSGSIIPKFIDQISSKKKIIITDPDATRFTITMDDALDFILESSIIGKGSEVFIPKLKAYSVTDLKQSLFEILENTGEKTIGLKGGEKMHETLINQDEARYAWELDNKYIIFSPLKTEKEIKLSHKKIKKANLKEVYSSNNVQRLSVKELKKIIEQSGVLNNIKN